MLAPAFGADARAEADHVLVAALALSRARLLAHPERVVTPRETEYALAWLERRARGEPLAYLTGNRGFWSLDLEVTRDVLVPRPETELVVERALVLGAGSMRRRVADLGTGSGAIALALAHERREWELVAIDASRAALDVAGRNAKRLGLHNVVFLHASWCAAIASDSLDLIVSNPPYIDSTDPAMRDAALRHEPRAALTPGEDGLAALRAIITHAPRCLRPGGWIVLEHGAAQEPQVASMLVARGFARVRCHRDLAGLPRVTEASFSADRECEP